MNLKRFFSARDMTTGKPWKCLLAFTVPMLIGNIFQQLYSVVDAVVVGHFIGDNALAAIGGTMALYFTLLVLFIGISSGAGIMVSQYFGAKKREDLSRTIGTSIVITLIVSVFVMIFAPLGVRPLLRLLDTPDTVIDLAATYINILLWGCVGVALYNILSGILRGLGDSFSPFIYLVIASILSAGLNVLFVGVFGWGITGAAVSTVFCQLFSGVLCLLRLMKMKNVFDMNLMYFRPVKKYILQVVRLGLPTGASQAVFSLAMLMMQSLVNSFGETMMSANTITMKIDGFVIMPIFTFANAVMAYTGQNVGAGKLDRVYQGARQCIIMSLGFAVVVVGVMVLFAYPLTGMFTDTPEVRSLSVDFLRILAVGYVFLAVGQIYWGVLRGAGDVMTPMWAAFITTILRVPTAYWFVSIMRNMYGIFEGYGILLSALMSWILGSILGICAYKFGKWRNKSIVKNI